MHPDDWQTRAQCKGVSPSIFFSEGKDREYLNYCEVCPVKGECLLHALIYNESGIWGGLTLKERMAQTDSFEINMLREDWMDSGLFDKYLT